MMEYYIFKLLVVIGRFMIGDVSNYGAAVAINKINEDFDEYMKST